MKRFILLLAAVAAFVAALAPVTAGAAPKAKAAQAQIISHVRTNDDGTATVKARYVCPDGFHLWVSAKQSEDGSRDPRLEGEGSSAVSAAWLQSHPTPDKYTCNGKWQVGTFTIDTEEQGFGELQRGDAWVQFCLIGSQFISESSWVKVK